MAEATIGWDVSGYYMYLPAFIIYQDPAQLSFKDEIIEKYAPTPSFQQAFPYHNGNYIMKYSMGQAVMYLPFFLVGHVIALITPFAADGFSLPYQLAISLGSLFIAFLGLWLMRKILLRFFEDWAVGVALIIIVFGSNYLEYASMSGAMTHNYLFTVYAGLILTTIKFYEHPTYQKGLLIGLLIGISALTRPTEIIVCLIPLLWGLEWPWGKFIQERFAFVVKNFGKYTLAGTATVLVGSLQLIYWKVIGGDTIIYSYEDQGFDWLHPHIMDCLFSYRAGWFIYSPIMVLAIIGFVPLLKKAPSLFTLSLIYTLLFAYIAFAWSIWWYGGSLGQRAMVQCYTVLLFPLTALVQWVYEKGWLKYILFLFMAVGIYHNFWVTHQAHKGGLFIPEQMTKGYFHHIMWKYDVHPQASILLDNDEAYLKTPKNVNLLASNDLEGDSLYMGSPYGALQGDGALWVDAGNQFSTVWELPLSNIDRKYLRISAQVKTFTRENEFWRMPQLVMELRNGDQIVKTSIIRTHRNAPPNSSMKMYVDMMIPGQAYDRVKFYVWNADGRHPSVIDELELLAFDPE